MTPDQGPRPGRARRSRAAGRSLLLVVLTLGAWAGAGAGQDLPAPPERPTAYLVTVGPGDAVWERFGHNLIWIHDPATGDDVGYNYGLFSFEQENFLLRFIQGRMRYWMAGLSVERQLEAYRSQNRSIRIQELALTADEVAELHRFLEWNERPENRFYGYDYYRDNCSTRVRDALDRILGGRLGAWARARPTDASYRDHTLRQTHGLFWVSVGMHFGLGPTVDEPLSAWEAMFIPMELEAHLRDFTVEGEGGEDVPFVRADWTYHQADRPPTPNSTPRWILSFGALGAVLSALFLALGRGVRAPADPGSAGPDDGRPTRRRALLALATLWLVVMGLVGTLIGLLWAFTDHWGTQWNLNLWHAGPLHLVLAGLIWFAFGDRQWTRRTARGAAAVVALLTLLGLGIQALPGPEQTNAEFLLLLVPTNLALAWTVWRAAAPPHNT